MLRKHIQIVHEIAAKPQCEQCDHELTDRGALRRHMLAQHKSFRPCRNYFSQEGNCKFNEICHFSHTQAAADMQRCYKYGLELASVSMLMEHRKKEFCGSLAEVYTSTSETLFLR